MRVDRCTGIKPDNARRSMIDWKNDSSIFPLAASEQVYTYFRKMKSFVECPDDVFHDENGKFQGTSRNA